MNAVLPGEYLHTRRVLYTDGERLLDHHVHVPRCGGLDYFHVLENGAKGDDSVGLRCVEQLAEVRRDHGAVEPVSLRETVYQLPVWFINADDLDVGVLPGPEAGDVAVGEPGDGHSDGCARRPFRGELCLGGRRAEGERAEQLKVQESRRTHVPLWMGERLRDRELDVGAV